MGLLHLVAYAGAAVLLDYEEVTMPGIFEKIDKIRPIYDVADKVVLFVYVRPESGSEQLPGKRWICSLQSAVLHRQQHLSAMRNITHRKIRLSDLRRGLQQDRS